MWPDDDSSLKMCMMCEPHTNTVLVDMNMHTTFVVVYAHHAFYTVSHPPYTCIRTLAYIRVIQTHLHSGGSHSQNRALRACLRGLGCVYTINVINTIIHIDIIIIYN